MNTVAQVRGFRLNLLQLDVVSLLKVVCNAFSHFNAYSRFKFSKPLKMSSFGCRP